jgi:hypothetical protein
MTEPLSPETLLTEFTATDTAWVLRDMRSGKYVMIPHDRFPNRVMLHFFMSRTDAVTILNMIAETGNRAIVAAPIIPLQVNLHKSLRQIASDKTPGNADALGRFFSSSLDAADGAGAGDSTSSLNSTEHIQ